MGDTMWELSSLDWFISINKMSPSFIYVVENIRIFFFLCPNVIS
jgi:hypothetical protein